VRWLTPPGLSRVEALACLCAAWALAAAAAVSLAPRVRVSVFALLRRGEPFGGRAAAPEHSVSPHDSRAL
jgi:hypothetical protein